MESGARRPALLPLQADGEREEDGDGDGDKSRDRRDGAAMEGDEGGAAAAMVAAYPHHMLPRQDHSSLLVDDEQSRDGAAAMEEEEENDDDDEEGDALDPASHQLTLPLLQHRSSFPVDHILKTWAGEFGCAQLLHCILTSLAWIPVASQTLVTIFAEKPPQWRCRSSLPTSSFTYVSTSLLSLLQDAAACSTTSSSICSMDPVLLEWVGGKHQSTVSEWSLFCENEYRVGLVQSAFFVGSLVGAGVFGNVSDSFLGRKGVLVLSSVISCIANLLTAASPNYWTYLLFRAATGFSNTGVGISSYVLLTEPVGPSKRGLVGLSIFYFFSVGTIMLSLLAYLCRSWRHLYIINFSLLLVYCLIILPFLRESPRWYLIRGRKKDALTVLTSIATRNGKRLPEGISVVTDKEYNEKNSKIFPEISSMEVPSESQRASEKFLDVFKASGTRTNMIVMVFVWHTCAVVYYGISLNVVNLGSNLYASAFLNAVAEIPAVAFTSGLIRSFGRRSLLLAMMLITGLFCLAGALVSMDAKDSEGVIRKTKVGCSMLVVFGTTGAYNVLYIYTAELFPTVVRNRALGLASQSAHVGAVIAPMVVRLGRIHAALPFSLFCVASLSAGLLALKLVDTSNKPLFDTIEGMQANVPS